jgi:hypothetical protein
MLRKIDRTSNSGGGIFIRPYELDQRELLLELLKLVTFDDENERNSAFWGDVRLKQHLMWKLGVFSTHCADETVESMSSFNSLMRGLMKGNQTLSFIISTSSYRVGTVKDDRRVAYSYCVNSLKVPDTKDNQQSRRSSRRSSAFSSTGSCSCRGGVHESRCSSFVFPSPPSFEDISDELSMGPSLPPSSEDVSEGPSLGPSLQPSFEDVSDELSPRFELAGGQTDGQALQSAPKPADRGLWPIERWIEDFEANFRTSNDISQLLRSLLESG